MTGKYQALELLARGVFMRGEAVVFTRCLMQMLAANVPDAAVVSS